MIVSFLPFITVRTELCVIMLLKMFVAGTLVAVAPLNKALIKSKGYLDMMKAGLSEQHKDLVAIQKRLPCFVVEVKAGE